MEREACTFQASAKPLVGAVAPIQCARIVAESGDGADGTIILITPAKLDNRGRFGHDGLPQYSLVRRMVSTRVVASGFHGSALPNSRSRRSEEHTSELQSLMRISYAVFCLKKKKKNQSTRKYNKT